MTTTAPSRHDTAKALTTYGGSFAASLGIAYLNCDSGPAFITSLAVCLAPADSANQALVVELLEQSGFLLSLSCEERMTALRLSFGPTIAHHERLAGLVP